MAGQQEALAEAVAGVLTGEGIDPQIATGLATAVARRATFDSLGLAIDLGKHIEAVKAENHDILTTFTPPASQPAPDTRTPMQRDTDAARARAAADRQARVDALTTMGNPFASATKNLTRQGLLHTLAPELAARLRAEACV